MPRARAMEAASSIPSADSTRAITGVVPRRRWKVSETWAAASVFASMTPRRPGMPPSASTSSDQKSLVRSLMRTQPLPPLLSQETTSSRAAVLRRGSTASSMSRMISSAREASAESKVSGLVAATRSHDLANSADTARVAGCCGVLFSDTHITSRRRSSC